MLNNYKKASSINHSQSKQRMSELVKISLDHLDGGRMFWPQCCPKCGATEDLICVEARVGVVHDQDGFSLSIFNTTTEATEFNFPVCKRHALKNEIGIRILEKSTAPNLLRFFIYFAFFMFCYAAFNIVTGDKELWLRIKGSNAFSGYLLFGALGFLTIIWARFVSSVWPVEMDLDTNIVSIRFASNDYAKEFKRANRKATHRLLTQPPVFFLRKRFWKWVFIVGALFYIARLMR